MPEIRRNLVTGDWVVIAPERAGRPDQFRRSRARVALPPVSPTCPFCPGNEVDTPAETLSVREDGRWLVRAVPNRYSALRADGDVERSGDDLARRIAGVGRHEVIVEMPEHDGCLALLPASRLQIVLDVYRRRFVSFYEDPRVAFVIVFKNHGEGAGTSLEHPHAQIVGLPVVPGEIRRRIEEAMRLQGDLGLCVHCQVLAWELAAGVRIVTANASFVAFVPWAALSPYHLWIFPRRHSACFATITEAELGDLAAILHDVLGRLHRRLGDPDYNYVVRSLSPAEAAVPYAHWYISVIPRLTRTAGFELGTGMFINVATPEASAAELRAAVAAP